MKISTTKEIGSITSENQYSSYNNYKKLRVSLVTKSTCFCEFSNILHTDLVECLCVVYLLTIFKSQSYNCQKTSFECFNFQRR